MDELRLVKSLTGSIESMGHPGFTGTSYQNLNTMNTYKVCTKHMQTLTNVIHTQTRVKRS